MTEKKYFNDSSFSSDTILIANNFNLENAKKIKNILLDVKNRKPSHIVGHPYTESIEYKYKQSKKDKKFGFGSSGDALLISQSLFFGLFVFIGVLTLFVLNFK